MKIAYVTSRFLLVSETFILREMEAVAARGLDVTPVALFPTPRGREHDGAARWASRTRRARPLPVAGSLAWWLARRPGRLLSGFALVAAGYRRSPGLLARALLTTAIAAHHARWARVEGVAHVHAHYATYGALSAWTIKRLAGVPYTFTAHAHDLYVDQDFLAEKVRDAEAVIAISEFNRRFLAGYGGGTATPVSVVRCGIDVGSYPFREREIPPSGPVRALCVASLQDYKGHRVLLDALVRGGERLQRLELTLVGDGPLAPDLREQARTLGLEERIRFAGSATEAQVRTELDRAHLFVLPSIVAASGQMEGLPVALMEAMASGLPVVSTRLSGIPELVHDGATGLLAAPADAGALADALAAVLAAPDAAAERVREARGLVERDYDIATSAAQVADLIRRAAR